MSIQYNQKLDETLLEKIYSIKHKKEAFLYQDRNIIEGLDEIFDYCYEQLNDHGYKCSKHSSKGYIYFDKLYGEKEKIHREEIKENKSIIICFQKTDYLKGGNLTYYNYGYTPQQLWKDSHILLNEGIFYKIEDIKGHGDYGYLVFYFPICK